ncbi:DNA-binding protein [Actinomadura sp. WAC 06369]|nr:DNA-binding protein [Actinomadura sp. WAC 06369]
MNEKHLSVADLAEREGVAIDTVYGWNRRGEGPRYMKIGRSCRYRIEDVLKWEETRLVDKEPTGEAA